MARFRLLALTAIAALVAIGPSLSYADKLTDAKNKAQQLASQQQATKSRITQLKSQANQLNTQVTQIQGQISSLQSSIVSTQVDIQRRNEEIAKLEQQITATQAKMKTQFGVLTKRVRLMYEAGQTSYFDVLFSATSFSDLLDRMQLLSMLAAQDQKVLKGIEATKQQLDINNQHLKQQQAMQRHVYLSLMNKQSLEQQAEQREMRILASVKDQQKQEEASLQSENSAMNNLQALIKQLQQEQGQYKGPATGWTWPVPGYTMISSPYGWRTWSDGTKEFHDGIDIPAPVGTPMVAATGGKVLYAGPATGFGDWIVIESANGYLEIYGHMYSWEIKVQPGEDVKPGQVIAAVGSNGFSTGPHLHFTIATGFNSAGFPISVDPMQYVHP